jgi:signal transduction histidine kinase/ligand-binding sensor domain-containing protein
MRRAAARAALLFLLPLTLAAAGAPPQFDIWTVENGLPQNSVTSILQARDGYLWLTTFDGLVRFDGVNFTVFNTVNSPGMKTNRLVLLFQDRGGAMWIVTESAGVTSLRDGTFRTYTTADGLPSNTVRRLRDLDDGSVLIETAKGLARFYDGKMLPYDATAKFADFGYPVTPAIVWHQDASGLHRVVDGHSMEDVALTGLPAGELDSVFEDSRHDLWCWLPFEGQHVWRWHAGAWKSYSVASHVRVAAEDPGGTVWLGTVEGDLVRLEGDQLKLYPPPAGITQELIHGFARDSEKGFWVGTSVLMRLRTPFIETYSKDQGLQSANVYPIMEDRQHRMWIGQWRGLTAISNGRALPMDLPEELSTGSITALFEDRGGGIWVGKLGDGLWRMANGGRFERVPGFKGIGVFAIDQDRDGEIWVGTARGLFHYDGSGVRRVYTTADGLCDNEIRSLHRDREGTLWVGTLAGLNRLRAGRIEVVNGVPRTQVRTVYEDANGVVWVGTYDRGLVRLAGGSSTLYTTAQGLASNGVFRILEDDAGRFWMSSNAGIYRVSRSDLEGVAAGKIRTVTSVLYGRREGMGHVECNGGTQPAGIRAHDGRLWFPTQGGAAVVDPARVPENRQPPAVRIEACLLDHEAVAAAGGLRVAPDRSDIEIHYTAISFVQPEHVRFRYQLEKLDANWVDAGSRRVVYYTHIPPGKYRFRVMAANSDGIWNLAGATINVTVEPPFWMTWWFRLAAAIAVVLAAAGLYRWRIRSLEAARVAQESFSRQLVASQEKERQRIAAELHDGLGQNLQVIKNWALLGSDANTERRLGEIAEIAAQSIEEVREIARNLRPHQLDELGLTQALRSIVTRIAPSSPVRFTMQSDEVDGLLDKEYEINLYRIVQECVNNILKHSEATEAQVNVARNGHRVEITITDNGKGFDVEATRSDPTVGSGLAGMVERARMIGGTVAISAAASRGCTTSVIVPFGRNPPAPTAAAPITNK